MILAAVVVLVANLALASTLPVLARGLAPAAATRLLTAGSLVVTCAALATLAIVSFNALAEVPAVASHAQWSTQILGGSHRVPEPVGIASLVVLATVLLAAIRAARQVARGLIGVLRADAHLNGHASRLLVVDDNEPDAFALPGLRGGRVVVTSAMLAALDPDERRVLLAHEDAHLRHVHVAYAMIATLVAGVNPAFRRLPSLVDISIERWADEDAALAVGDRRLAARSLARAALAARDSRGWNRPSVAPPAGARSPVQTRAVALLAPRPRTRARYAVAALATCALAVSGSLGVAQTTEDRFEAAHSAFQTSVGPGR